MTYVNGYVELTPTDTVADGVWAGEATYAERGKELMRVGLLWTKDGELDADRDYAVALASAQIQNLLGFLASGFGPEAAIAAWQDAMTERGQWMNEE